MPKLVKRIKVPTSSTLRKYGLTVGEWTALLRAQGNVCYICKRIPMSGTWVTDHEHVPKFKKMKPEERKRFVRGVICRFCNSHVVGRFVTLEKARNAVAYLERYEARKNGAVK